MGILWRFMWCVAAVAWAGNSVANPVSGAYLNQGQNFAELLQITAKSDGSVEGTMMQAELRPDGSLSQTNNAITGAVDGHAITIVIKRFLQTTSLSGTFDGGAFEKGVITLALPDGSARYVESDMNGYQAALRSLKNQGAEINKRRHINDENATVAALNERLTEFTAKVQNPRIAHELAEFHATHEKTLAKARHNLKVEQTHPPGSVQANQIDVAILQVQIGLESYDSQWESAANRNLDHLRDLDKAIAQSLCARSEARLSNCDSAPETIRAYQAIKPLVKSRSADVLATIKADHMTMDIIVKQADAYSEGRPMDENAAARAVKSEQGLRDKAALAKAMHDAVLGAASIPYGTADPNQAGGVHIVHNYAAKVRACIQPRVAYSKPPRNGSNPTVQYRVDLSPSGMVESAEVKRSSGIPEFDQAVMKGIRGCSPFPLPPNGRYPSYMDVNYYMYD